MLTLPRSVRIFLATGPVDLRKSIDGLGALARERSHDLFSGHLFVFTSRRGDRIKVLTWDHGGFVLYYKRLEPEAYRLLVALRGGASLADACASAFSGSNMPETHAAESIREWFQVWMQLGWLAQ